MADGILLPGIKNPPERLTVFDAARGIAMLLVCVSHFLDEYHLTGLGQPQEMFDIIAQVCRIATPMFVLVSGIILGYLYRTTGHRFHDLRTHLIDKALFLLTIGHFLMAAFTAEKTSFSNSIGQGYITDTLAICVIGFLLLVPYTTAATRFGCGIGLYVGSWIWYSWSAHIPEVVKGIFLGPQSDGTLLFFFPLLPWFGVHLVGSYLGEQFSQHTRDELYRQVSGRLAKLAATVLVVILMVKVLYAMFVGSELLTPSNTLSLFVSTYQKYPPGPAYILFFGGMALLLMSGLLLSKSNRWFEGPMRSLETLGRNSLPAFLLQYFVYYTVLHWLVTETAFITPFVGGVYLLLSILGLFASVRLLDRHHIQRVWTVGLPTLLEYWPGLNRNLYFFRSSLK